VDPPPLRAEHVTGDVLNFFRLKSHVEHVSSCIEGSGRNDGGAKGAQLPWAPNHYGGAEKSQQCHKYFLQYGTVQGICLVLGKIIELERSDVS